MTAQRQTAQHHAQIRKLQRSVAINVPAIAACLVATGCSYVYEWHIVIRVFLTFVSFMQLMHLPGLFTRLAEQKRKLAAASAAVEASAGGSE